MKTISASDPGNRTQSESTLYNNSTDDLSKVTIAVPKAKRGQSTGAAKRRGSQKTKLNSSFDATTRMRKQVVADDSKLVRRSGTDISGIFFVLSIYELDNASSVLIDASNSANGLQLRLVVKVPPHENVYNFVESVIPRIRLDRNEAGQACLKIVRQEQEHTELATGIIYKKAHFISNRYFIVTVSQIEANTKIAAFEPDKNQTLEFSLSRKGQLRNCEATHDQLSKLIK